MWLGVGANKVFIRGCEVLETLCIAHILEQYLLRMDETKNDETETESS
jgi:hypothetical protein